MKKNLIILLLICGVCFAGAAKTSLLLKIKDHIVSNNLTYEQLDDIKLSDLNPTEQEIQFAQRFPRAIRKWVKHEYMSRKREAIKPAILTALKNIRTGVVNQGFTQSEATQIMLEVIAEATNE